LATQAERLQATIAYFRIDEAESRLDVAATQLRATAARMGAPAKASVRPADKTRAGRRTLAGGGFALDMGEGDARDADFIRAA
jgi:methyl-accepting chemotaxis protein